MKTLNTAISTFVLSLALTGSLISLGAATAQTEASVAAQQQQLCACFEVKVTGNGPAIILIPGVASSGKVWQSTVEALQGNYQLHVFTLAGFAGVAPLPMQSWGEGYLSTQQDAILRYINQQKLDKPVVIGHSLGGYLALALAAKAPEQISAAINVDGLPALGALFAQSNTQASTATTAKTADKAPQRSNFDPMAMAKGMTNDASWQQRIVEDMYRSDGMTSGRVMGELMQADLRPQLANIRVPVLTLGALQHGAPYSTPEQVQANYEKQLANIPTQYHSFAFSRDSKHFIMADTPKWLNQQIQQFLQQHPRWGQ